MPRKPAFTVTALGAPRAGKTALADALAACCAAPGVPADPPAPLPGGTARSAYETAAHRYVHYDARAGRLAPFLLANGLCPQIAVLVAAADEPLAEALRGPLRWLRWIRPGRVIAFLNKADLVASPEALDRAELELRELIAEEGLGGDEALVLRGSALAGRHAPPLKALLEALDACALISGPDEAKPLQLVARSSPSAVDGRRAFAARVLRGRLRVGDAVERPGKSPYRFSAAALSRLSPDDAHLPLPKRARLPLGERGYAGAWEEVLITPDVDAAVGPGLLLTAPGQLSPTRRFAVEAYLLSAEEGGLSAPLPAPASIEVHLHNNYWHAAVVPGGDAALSPGERRVVELELKEPLALAVGLRLLLTQRGQHIGGGIVTALID